MSDNIPPGTPSGPEDGPIDLSRFEDMGDFILVEEGEGDLPVYDNAAVTEESLQEAPAND